jgi:hypothetical protein
MAQEAPTRRWTAHAWSEAQPAARDLASLMLAADGYWSDDPIAEALADPEGDLDLEGLLEHCAESVLDMEGWGANVEPDVRESYWGTRAGAGEAALYFASGSNHEGEVLGLADAGYNVGVAVHELDRQGAALRALLSLAKRAAHVFADSGAFDEFMAQIRGKPCPITDAQWLRRLATYRQLAEALGWKLWCVAPDKVADQGETLARQARYADQVRELHALGAQIIVPVQKGEQSMAAFFSAEAGVLGIAVERLVAGIPMKADSTTDEVVRAFCREAQPRRVHLLGLGPESPRFEAVAEIVRAEVPDAVVTCDSVLVRRLAGKKNGRGGGPRSLTYRRGELLDLGHDEERVAALKHNCVASHLLDACAAGIDEKERIAVAEGRSHFTRERLAPALAQRKPSIARAALRAEGHCQLSLALLLPGAEPVCETFAAAA